MDGLGRWRILRLHVEDGIPLTALARQTGTGLRTLQRWHHLYKIGGVAALELQPRADAGARRIPAELVAFIEGLALSSATNAIKRSQKTATKRSNPHRQHPPSPACQKRPNMSRDIKLGVGMPDDRLFRVQNLISSGPLSETPSLAAIASYKFLAIKGYTKFSWDQSEEKKKYLHWSLITWGVYTILSLVGLALGVTTYYRNDGNSQEIITLSVWIFVAIFIFGISAIITTVLNKSRLMTKFTERVLNQPGNNEISEKVKSADFDTLWREAKDNIEIYHTLATRQAKDSFRAGRIAAIVGFVAVIVIGVVVAFASNGTSAIAASIVGVAAAGMSGYIGATFMKAQTESSAQLRQFFLQPVEAERLLALERLMDKLDDEHKSQAIIEVVKATYARKENFDGAE